MDRLDNSILRNILCRDFLRSISFIDRWISRSPDEINAVRKHEPSTGLSRWVFSAG